MQGPGVNGKFRHWNMPTLDRKPCYRRTVLKEEHLYYILRHSGLTCIMWTVACSLTLVLNIILFTISIVHFVIAPILIILILTTFRNDATIWKGSLNGCPKNFLVFENHKYVIYLGVRIFSHFHFKKLQRSDSFGC